MAVAWVTAQDVIDARGIDPATDADEEFLTLATASANEEAFRYRERYGYADNMSAAPDDAVKFGTLLLAERNYRMAGGRDEVAGFDSMGGVSTLPSLAEIKRKLGVARPTPAVA